LTVLNEHAKKLAEWGKRAAVTVADKTIKIIFSEEQVFISEWLLNCRARSWQGCCWGIYWTTTLVRPRGC